MLRAGEVSATDQRERRYEQAHARVQALTKVSTSTRAPSW
jgi:hypothetical protein